LTYIGLFDKWGVSLKQIIFVDRSTMDTGNHTVSNERRHFSRAHISPVVLYRFAGECSNRSPVEVKCLDISEGGIRLLLSEEPKSKDIQLMIYAPYPPISISGEVVWINRKETEKGKFFETGIRFTEPKPIDKEKTILCILLDSEME